MFTFVDIKTSNKFKLDTIWIPYYNLIRKHLAIERLETAQKFKIQQLIHIQNLGDMSMTIGKRI